MRYTFLCLSLFMTALLLKPASAKANHAAGGEIIFEHIIDSTYRFFLRMYADCDGLPVAGSQTLCFYNNCNNTGFTVAAQLFPGTTNGKIQPVLCGQATRCSDPNAAFPGYREWWYEVVVTMPALCNDWVVSASMPTRNAVVNLQNPNTGNLYLETRMDIAAPHAGNSSAYSPYTGIMYACLGQPSMHSVFAIDPDGDSVTTEIVAPLTGSCSAPVNAAFATANPPYAIPSNPIQTNNTFAINSDGVISFTPQEAGRSSIMVRIKEYRNNVLITTILREVQVYVAQCSTPPPPPGISLVQGPNVVNGKIEGCVGETVSFCFDVKAGQGAVIKVWDNHNITIPGSVLTYSAQNTDSIRGCFVWVPPAGAQGKRSLNIIVVDSTCSGQVVPTYQTFTIPVIIGKYPHIEIQAAPDTNIGTGQTVTFTAATYNCNNTTYQWQLNGVDVSNATNDTWVTSSINHMDVVTCKLVCTDTCLATTDTISNALTMHVGTSIGKISGVAALSAYPNPNAGAFNIAGYAHKQAAISLELINMMGQLVYSETFAAGKGAISKQVHLSDVVSGIYTLRIKTDDTVQTIQLSINR